MSRWRLAPEVSGAVVSLRGLTRRFGMQDAVQPLTFDVAHGELFGIVGPDGAGKTTTLRMLAGVLPPTGGDAFIEEVSIATQPERAKPALAYMAQRFGLYEDLTVIENITFYADLYRVPRAERPARLARLWRFSNLEPFQHRLAGKLSGGMKQKLSLSCALIHHPRVLLLDEPTFGVDPISRQDLWLILQEMVAEGVTVILSTSYLDEAERCDRVVLLDQGRVLALDAPAALQHAFPDMLVRVYTDAPRSARDVLRTHPAVRSATLFGDALHVSLGAWAEWQAAALALERAGIAVREATPIDASLEDVFIRLVTQDAVS
jgi:ABC-2 type transport system ATP-binding protein